MAYLHTNKRHNRRYEQGIFTGKYRDIQVVHADSAFDSLDNDNRLHVLNAHAANGCYIDTVAVSNAYDDEHAKMVAGRQFDSLGAASFDVVAFNSRQFDSLDLEPSTTWPTHALDNITNNPSQKQSFLPAITASELRAESTRTTFEMPQWDGMSLASHGGSDAMLYQDMVRADHNHELVAAFDITQALKDVGATYEAFDSLMDTSSRLPLLKDRLFKAMSAVTVDGISVSNVTQTKPFKRMGMKNVAFVFDMSDGQKISIWFHNPDSTPSKIMPSDIMISWKWLLNSRDVTAVLSPKHGDNVQLPALAGRMMRLVAKNSKRFQTTQARQAKTNQDLLDAQKLVDDKTATIEQLDKDIESLNKQIDEAVKAVNAKPESAATDDNSGRVIDLGANNLLLTEFKEIEGFYKSENRLPSLNGDNLDEKILARRLNAIIKKGYVERLKPYDDLGILDLAQSTPEDEHHIATYIDGGLRQLVTVTYSKGLYQIKTANGTESALMVQSVIDKLKDIKAENPSMRLDSGTDILEAVKDKNAASVVEVTSEPEPTEIDAKTLASHIAAVNKAFKFQDATDDFKAALYKSIDLDDYSPFLSATTIEKTVKKRGGKVSWIYKPTPEGWMQVEGVITHKGTTIGHTDMGADGKAMVFVGDIDSDERAISNSYYSESLDAIKSMVEALFDVVATDASQPEPQEDLFSQDVTTLSDGELQALYAKTSKASQKAEAWGKRMNNLQNEGGEGFDFGGQEIEKISVRNDDVRREINKRDADKVYTPEFMVDLLKEYWYDLLYMDERTQFLGIAKKNKKIKNPMEAQARIKDVKNNPALMDEMGRIIAERAYKYRDNAKGKPAYPKVLAAYIAMNGGYKPSDNKKLDDIAAKIIAGEVDIIDVVPEDKKKYFENDPKRAETSVETTPSTDASQPEPSVEPTTIEDAVMTATDNAHPAFSSDDIDYLNGIMSGAISPDDVDMDKVIAIGEKDEHDPLFSQALDVVINAADKESANM